MELILYSLTRDWVLLTFTNYPRSTDKELEPEDA